MAGGACGGATLRQQVGDTREVLASVLRGWLGERQHGDVVCQRPDFIVIELGRLRDDDHIEKPAAQAIVRAKAVGVILDGARQRQLEGLGRPHFCTRPWKISSSRCAWIANSYCIRGAT